MTQIGEQFPGMPTVEQQPGALQHVGNVAVELFVTQQAATLARQVGNSVGHFQAVAQGEPKAYLIPAAIDGVNAMQTVRHAHNQVKSGY